MRGYAIIATVLISTAAEAAQLPFSGIYGTPGACAVFALAGRAAVFREGLDENGDPLPVEIEEDDGFLLLEPAQLTTAGLTCSVSKLVGTGVTFACSDGKPLTASVIIRSNSVIVFDDGDDDLILKPCTD